VNRIRSKLIVAFLAATIVPLVATMFIMTSLLERSLSYATTEELDRLSESLHETALDYYQQAREDLKEDAMAGAVTHRTLPVSNRAEWPASALDFWDSGESERFDLAGVGGEDLEYFVRHPDGVWIYTQRFGKVRMDEITAQYRNARELVGLAKARDLRRGLTTTLIVLVAAVWLVSLAWLIYLATRMSHPIQQLTSGLSGLASGDLSTRIQVSRTGRDDEIGQAITAFNHTAAQLEQNRDRLVYLTQIASWQTLARKMAHELKNSMTPIRLTVEEILARQPESERPFIAQASQIVVNEIESLERRVRAFSEFSAEPEVKLSAFDINTILEERISFLKPGHPEIEYRMEADRDLPPVRADADRIKGILNNLLENAAEAIGARGQIVSRSYVSNGQVAVEIHDSGPGLSGEALRTLFEPTITFKARGMGLGLSIARKDALVCGGDLLLIDGKLGGAGFRLVLPREPGS
jgi:two-component system, NtrC family, nitrogen regulation sensor histidine kinase NtrY